MMLTRKLDRRASIRLNYLVPVGAEAEEESYERLTHSRHRNQASYRERQNSEGETTWTQQQPKTQGDQT